jgi:spore germination cell wall hydrolase CwlJ-like protein
MISAALMCMALNVYHESRSENLKGQVAVANVTLNRVADSKWPNDVCSVVEQGYTKGKQNCQFSWYCDGKSDTPTDTVAWARAVLVANDVMMGYIPDITEGATHYHARYVNPYWVDSFTKTVEIGSHMFYK